MEKKSFIGVTKAIIVGMYKKKERERDGPVFHRSGFFCCPFINLRFDDDRRFIIVFKLSLLKFKFKYELLVFYLIFL